MLYGLNTSIGDEERGYVEGGDASAREEEEKCQVLSLGKGTYRVIE